MGTWGWLETGAGQDVKGFSEGPGGCFWSGRAGTLLEGLLAGAFIHLISISPARSVSLALCLVL